MVKSVACDTHGASEAAYVCLHLLDTAKDGIPRGFNWLRDAEGEIQAFCDDCWDATDEEWEWISDQGPKLICRGCLEQVAEINGANMMEED